MDTHLKKKMNIVLLGMTGEGKSSTGNTIMGCSSFKASSNKESCTKTAITEIVEIDGVTIRIVDTPGLCATHDKQDVTLQNIFSAMTECPEGFDALIYVISYTGRFTNDGAKTLAILRKSFGDRFLDHCVVVVTHGINFDREEDQTIDQWCRNQRKSEDLDELFKLCNYRVVLFYNTIPVNKKTQQANNPEDVLKQKNCVKQLLHMIKSIPGRYTNADFKNCAIEREKLMLEGKIPMLTVAIDEKIGLLKTEVKKAAMNIKTLEDSKIKNLQQRAKTIITEIEKTQGETGLMNDLLENAQKIERKINQLPERKKDLSILLHEIEELTEKLKNPPSRKMMIFKYILGTAGSVSLAAISAAIPIVNVATAGLAMAAGVASGGAVVGTVVNVYKDKKKYESKVAEQKCAELKLKENKEKEYLLTGEKKYK